MRTNKEARQDASRYSARIDDMTKAAKVLRDRGDSKGADAMLNSKGMQITINDLAKAERDSSF